jgi:hypothetical protein
LSVCVVDDRDSSAEMSFVRELEKLLDSYLLQSQIDDAVSVLCDLSSVECFVYALSDAICQEFTAEQKKRVCVLFSAYVELKFVQVGVRVAHSRVCPVRGKKCGGC